MKSKQVFHNAKWIIVCKIAQSVIQLLIGMLSARYLGPSNYGLINYASSIVAFVLPIMKLGMDAVLVYELVSEPDKEGEIMGTSLCLNIVSSLICMAAVAVFASVMNPNAPETVLVCVLYSISVFFAALEMIQYWFQYKLLSKYSSAVMLAGYIVVSVYKVYLLASAKSVYWFAVSHAIEYGFIGVLLIGIYRKCGGRKLSFRFARAKSMLARSKHYILAAMMVMVIQNTDHVMLTSMVGTAENGIYSAAITCASVAQFVYTAIIDSFRPLILSSRNEKPEEYERNISRLYCIITYLALANSAVFTLFAGPIISLLYGQAYMGAVPVLRILVWYRAFSFMGTIRNIWMIAEEKQKYLPGINLLGVGCNVVMNYFMIPHWHACGAALASLLTQFIINFLLGFMVKPLKKNNELLIKGVAPGFVAKELRTLVRSLRKSPSA